MPHTRSIEAKASNAAPDTRTRDLFIITLPDPDETITLYLATADLVIGAQVYEGRIRSTPALGYSEGGNIDGGSFTIDNLDNLYGPTFLNTARRLDGAEVVILRAWRLSDGTWEDTDPVSGLTYEIMRGVLRTQPISDTEVQCNIVSDTSDSSIIIGGDPIFQHCDKFYNKGGNHPLGGPCGRLRSMLGTQVETATVEGIIVDPGNATVVVTAAGMTSSPKSIDVAVLADDTAAVVAGKIRTALAADVDVSAFFEVKGTEVGEEKVRIFTKTKAAHDTTMNISVDNGTSTGLVAALVSEHTSDIYCDKTLDGPLGCKSKGNTRHGGIPGLAPTVAVVPLGGLLDPTGGYGPGSGPHRPPILDPDRRFPFPREFNWVT